MRPSNLRPVEFDAHWSARGGVSSHHKIQGYFHRWGEKLNSITDRKTSLYSAAEVVGIIEAENGLIYEAPAESMRFLDSDAPDADEQYPEGGGVY